MMNDLGTITLPPRLRAAILSELKPGEHVIWMDQPDPEFIGWNSPTDVGFGLVFLLLGVGLAWMFAWEMRDPMSWTHDLALAYQYGEGRFAAAIGDFVAVGVGILLAILGCWLLLSPWRRRKRALHSAYALTGQRAIWFRPDWRGRIVSESLLPEELTNVEHRSDRGRYGHVVFVREFTDDEGQRRRFNAHGFWAVRNPEQVAALVRTVASAEDGCSAGGAPGAE